jgi:ABC-type branched-subunit amino acid transport system substrate-binding protein
VDGYFVAVLFGNFTRLVEAWKQLPDDLSEKVLAAPLGVGPTELRELGARLVGMVQAPAGLDDPRPALRTALREAARAFPRVSFDVVGLLPGALYATQVEAVLRAVEAAEGDLSGGQRRFRAALARTEVEALLTGRTRLDSRGQAVTPIVLGRAEHRDGAVRARRWRTVPDVDQTLGGLIAPDAAGFTRDEPRCRRQEPPRWAVSRPPSR